MKIGVLAAQGAFAEHIAVLHKLEVDAVPVRLPRELAGLDGLIIPVVVPILKGGLWFMNKAGAVKRAVTGEKGNA